MANKYLANAKKQTTSIQDILAEYVGPLHANQRGLYISGLGSLAKSVNDVGKFKEFEVNVKNYLKATGQKNQVLEDFGDFTTLIKNGQRVYLDSDLNKKKKSSILRSTKPSDIRRAYVMYWTDRIIHEHNIRIKKAQSLSKKHNMEFYEDELDIRVKTIVPDIGIVKRTITPEELFNAASSDKVLLRSDEKIFALLNKIPSRNLNKILDKTKHTLSDFKNIRLLFFSNLLRALYSANWDEAIPLVEEILKNSDKYSPNIIYDAYEESDIDIVFEYKEQVSSEMTTTAQQKFVNALVDKMSKYK